MAAAIWAVIVNLRLLLYAYGRSLDLISPLEQLAILKRDGDAQVRVWERRFVDEADNPEDVASKPRQWSKQTFAALFGPIDLP